MTGKDLLLSLKDECLTIGHYNKIKKIYQSFLESLNETEIINHFHHMVKKSDGLNCFEICFFNAQFIHDITISPKCSTHTSLKITSINMVSITTDTENANFTFEIKSNSNSLVYTFELEKLDEVCKIKNQILALSNS